MSKLKLLTAAAMLAAVSSVAVAAERDTENRVYLGLSRELGSGFSATPDLVVGVRTLRVSSSNSVDGADLSARVTLKDGVALDSTRLVYVGGERDLMANVGVGYSIKHKSLLGTAAVQGPHIRAGADYLLGDGSVKPYVEVNTLAKPAEVKKPEGAEGAEPAPMDV